MAEDDLKTLLDTAQAFKGVNLDWHRSIQILNCQRAALLTPMHYHLAVGMLEALMADKIPPQDKVSVGSKAGKYWATLQAKAQKLASEKTNWQQNADMMLEYNMTKFAALIELIDTSQPRDQPGVLESPKRGQKA